MKTIPAYEKELYDEIAGIRAKVLELKNNRTKYISSRQVYAIYDEFLDRLHELLLTRKDEELKGITLALPNATDVLVDEIWSILLLCFVTCGLTKFAPATYLSLLTVYKLLGHLRACQVYTMDDLEPIRKRLEDIKDIIVQLEEKRHAEEHEEAEAEGASAAKHRTEELLLLRNKWNKCMGALTELENIFKTFPPDLEPIYLELVVVRKQLLNLLTAAGSQLQAVLLVVPGTLNGDVGAQLEDLKVRLHKIELLRTPEGKFPSRAPEEAQANLTMVLNGLLDDCNNFIHDLEIQHQNPDISNLFQNLSIKGGSLVQEFETLYTRLIKIKLTLENLMVTRRWTMRETDLYNYAQQLKLIDDERLAKLAQTLGPDDSDHRRLNMILLYMLRRCYLLIYKLLESLEPVSESLQPILNQLSTVRRCLLEIKRIDGLSKLKELYPYQFKLASLDNLRQDGKFYVNGTIPEGQGLLNALLAECFDIMDELKIELEEKEETEEINDDASSTRDSVAHDDLTDEDDIQTDDEVELKRKRYVGLTEADYDRDSDSCVSDFSDLEYEGNDYY